MSTYQPDQPTAMADLARFLSACYYEPALEFAEEDLMGSIVVATRAANADLLPLALRLREAFVGTDLQTLLIDYSQLFVGPMTPTAAPYACAWLPAPSPTQELAPSPVLALYEASGMVLDDEFQDLPDHLAVELELLYLLIFNENQARRTANGPQVVQIQALRQEFLNEHLQLWIGPFSRAVAEHAQTPFYRDLALLTAQFVQMQDSTR